MTGTEVGAGSRIGADLGNDAVDVEPGVERVARTRLPTAYGDFTAYGYRSAHGTEQLALVYGDLPGASTGSSESMESTEDTEATEDVEAAEVLVRLHSECLTGDVLGSLRCDCGPQLQLALEEIARAGRGVLVYLRGHEGRGIGLALKLAAYALQDGGHDTVDANLALGLPADARDYADGAAILHDLGVGRVRLLTNNPAKAAALREHGITVAACEPLLVAANPENIRYLRTKRDRFGHLLPTR
ncbi:GTP cyclohydrolase II [Actinopolymorpha pittospori]|uniref:GTP cyclohydrolase-2 n=1 Tax=Actinopolymorpha pittospori TaxID=648752 RepID=A0A927MSL2_9ACTN|nr:GTP cyclohydrolase II [Actinopolymorpha pittospori]MBE1606140.1 3,4-dihydroxy 2-butanone 4-phosphate synthase/GTP cyclohydrolase II [Actinopolymorpha pittospori]